MKIILFYLTLLLFSCQSTTGDKTGELAAPLARLQAGIDSLFHAKIADDEPGAAILIAVNGEALIKKGFGVRDLRTKAPITPTTNMRLASVSKQFTALTVLSLVDQELVALDDTVSKYLPYPAFDNVTIQQFLNHTSGIANYDQYLNNWDQPRIAENHDLLAWYAAENPAPEFAPGTKYEYSNAGYNLLATLVETVSNMEFGEYARKHVFEKAGMQATNYFNLARPVDIPERAFCYEQDSTGKWKQVDSNILNGMVGEGAIYTSISDYLAYDRALLNKSILSEAMHDLIFVPTSVPFVQSGREFRYGMGWLLRDTIALHAGGWYGTTTMTKRYLTVPLTLAIFTNRHDLFESGLYGQADRLVRKYMTELGRSSLLPPR